MKCGICASTKVREYFEVRNSPGLQNVLYDSEASARNAPVVDTGFWLCTDCLFLFNPHFESQSYSSAYNNDQSFSSVYRTHLEEVVALLNGYLKPNHTIVEIGCGNGAILRLLRDSGHARLEGFDPTYAGELDFVRREYWRPRGRSCDGLILRHTLESMVDFRGLLTAAVAELSRDGIIYLELTNSRHIVERAFTLHLYHEYPQYFSETAIGRLLDQLGCYVHETRHFFGGEMLGIVARRRFWQMPRPPNLAKLKAFGKVYIWGISGRTIHFLTHHDIGSEVIRYGVDMDPKKQGRYIPRTGQMIVSPADCIAAKPDAVVVLNESYVEEVAGKIPEPVTILTYRDFYDE
jgi:methyltransferase family protein/C-methyltransferase-like protein